MAIGRKMNQRKAADELLNSSHKREAGVENIHGKTTGYRATKGEKGGTGVRHLPKAIAGSN